jgi:hypothetical protein
MIDPLFQFHKLNDEGIKRGVEIAEAFTDLWNKLQPLLPVSAREVSIVRTKLEEASFFAKKAMANVPENQDCWRAAHE